MREETRLLRQFLRDKAIANEIALYTDIDTSVGWDKGSAKGKRRGVLSSALAWVEKEHGYLAECVTNQGYQFLQGDKAIITSEQVRARRIVAQVGKFADTIDNCAIDATPETLYVARSKLNFMEWSLSAKTQYELESMAHKAKEELIWNREAEKRRALMAELAAME
jgi:hypothetical protein